MPGWSPAPTWRPAVKQATRPGAGPRVVTVEEADWTASGPTALHVELSGERVHLPLPEADVAVRVLRGHGWRRPDAPVRPGGQPGFEGQPAVHAPRLPGYDPVLLARGERAGQLVQQRIPLGQGPAARARTHQFEGDVVAASVIGRRLVVMLASSGRLRVRVVGKHLANVHRIDLPIEALELTAADVEAAAQQPPAELFFEGGSLAVCLAGRWWLLRQDGDVEPWPGRLATVASGVTDTPFVLNAWGTTLSVYWRGLHQTYQLGSDQRPAVVTGGGLFAWQRGPQLWHWAALPDRPGEGVRLDVGNRVSIPSGFTALATAQVGGRGGVLAIGEGGVLVLATVGETLPLTAWSGGTGTPVVHAHQQLIAVQRPDGAVEVGRLDTDEVLVRLGGSA